MHHHHHHQYIDVLHVVPCHLFCNHNINSLSHRRRTQNICLILKLPSIRHRFLPFVLSCVGEPLESTSTTTKMTICMACKLYSIKHDEPSFDRKIFFFLPLPLSRSCSLFLCLFCNIFSALLCVSLHFIGLVVPACERECRCAHFGLHNNLLLSQSLSLSLSLSCVAYYYS